MGIDRGEQRLVASDVLGGRLMSGDVTGRMHFLSGFRPSGWSNATSHLSTSTVSGNGRIIGHEINTTSAVTTVEFFMALGSMAAGSRLIVSAR